MKHSYKFTRKTIFFALSILCTTTGFSQVQIGPKLGIVYSQFNEEHPTDFYFIDEHFKHRSLQLGVSSKIFITDKLDVQAEVDYFKTGASVNDYTAFDGGQIYFDASFLRVSLLPHYYVFGKFSLGAGAYVNRMMKSNYHEWSGWTFETSLYRQEQYFNTYNTGGIINLAYRLNRFELSTQYSFPFDAIGEGHRERRLHTIQSSIAYFFGKMHR